MDASRRRRADGRGRAILAVAVLRDGVPQEALSNSRGRPGAGATEGQGNYPGLAVCRHVAVDRRLDGLQLLGGGISLTAYRLRSELVLVHRAIRVHGIAVSDSIEVDVVYKLASCTSSAKNSPLRISSESPLLGSATGSEVTSRRSISHSFSLSASTNDFVLEQLQPGLFRSRTDHSAIGARFQSCHRPHQRFKAEPGQQANRR